MAENAPGLASVSDEDFGILVLRHLDDSLDDQGTSILYAEMLRDVGRRRQFVRLHLRSVKLAELLRPQLFDDPDNSAPATLDDAHIIPALRLQDEQLDPAASTLNPFGETAEELPVAPPTRGSVTLRRTGQPFWQKPWQILRTRPGPMGWGLAAAVLLASAISLTLILRQLGVFGGSPAPLAMGPSLDAIWADPNAVPAQGNLIKTGVPQSLLSGYAELTSSNGLTVIIQGPAIFTVERPGLVSLSSGKLTAVVPKPAHGFTVNTPIASVIDLGTEFGVSVSPTGDTDVQTFRGAVSLASTASPASSPPAAITAGIARHVGSSGDITEIPADTVAFVRPQQFDDWKAMPQASAYERWKAYSDRLRLDPDLVAYYTFDKSDAAPEGLLNRVAITGAALDGVLRGTDRTHERPVWTDGRWPGKGALGFMRDAHMRVEIPVSTGGPLDFSRGNQTAAPFTICAWIRADDPHPKHSSIFLRDIDAGAKSQQFALELYPDSSIRASVGDVIAASPKGRATGKWQQIAFVYDPENGSLVLYLDGSSVARRGDAPRQLPGSRLPLSVGCREGSQWTRMPFLPPMAGRMDEFAVFRRALTAQEVQAMYSAEKPD